MSKALAALTLQLRSAVYWGVFAGTTLAFGLLIGTAGWLMPTSRAYGLARTWCRMNIHALRWICGIRWRVTGREHLPERNCIFFAKHQSTWETMALVALLPPQVHVIKRELLRIPFFGWGHARLRPIAIDRGAGQRAVDAVVAQGRQRLAAGWNVMIFPEGTRVRPGETARYRMGGALLASETATPVVPIAHNAGQLWPRNSFIKRPGVVDIAIGPRIDTTAKEADVINGEARAWIEARMATLFGAGASATAG